MQRALATLVTISAAVTGACVADNGDEGIFITKNVVPGDGCTFTASESEAFYAHGTLSTASPSSYRLNPQMISRISAAEGQEDQRTVILQGARVDIEFADPDLAAKLDIAGLQAAGVTKFQALFTAPLSPGGVADGSFDLITRRLIDEVIRVEPSAGMVGSAFRTELIAKTVVYGDMSGSEVTSQPFQYPVTLCANCVVRVMGACPLPMGTMAEQGNPCNPYQDGIVDCCTSGTDVICPATISTTPPV